MTQMGWNRPLVLAVETSCDDTACALLDGHGRVLASTVSSQPLIHRPFGGVVPELAAREHLRNWPAVSAATFAEAGVELAEVDLVAATHGPGLVGALLVGLSLGKSLAFGLGRPFHAVHHLEGHLYSPFLAPPGEPAASIPEEFVGLVVSGGHTSLFAVQDGQISTRAETRDDAIGEVFDKVGKRLGLPYPQGPLVDAIAEHGDPAAFPFSVARLTGRTRAHLPGHDRTLDVSYSGLKSQVVQTVDRLERQGVCWGAEVALPVKLTAGATPTNVVAAELAASSPVFANLLAGFRAAAIAQLVDRLETFYTTAPFSRLAVSGGVAANRLLRRELPAWGALRGVTVDLVPLRYAGDNAAMIGFAALLRFRRGSLGDPLSIDAASRLPLAS